MGDQGDKGARWKMENRGKDRIQSLNGMGREGKK
jgi:hypothetical protein